MSDLLGVGFQIVLQLPVLLVLFAGVVVALTAMRRDRRRAGLAAVGFAVLLVGAVVSAVPSLLPWFASSLGLSVSSLSALFFTFAIVGMLLALVGWALVIVALLVRPPAAAPATTPPSFGGMDANAAPGRLS